MGGIHIQTSIVRLTLPKLLVDDFNLYAQIKDDMKCHCLSMEEIEDLIFELKSFEVLIRKFSTEYLVDWK